MLRSRWMMLMCGLLLAGMLVPGAASAASGRTVYVDRNGTANAAGKGACGKPNYTTIQAAVNDTSAKVIIVCKGTYVEAVTVDHSVTLQGRTGAVIQAPAGEIDGIVSFEGPQTSRITGFIITGAGSNLVSSGIRTRGFVGDEIYYGPTHVTISRNHVTDIHSISDNSNGGTGIFISKSQGEVNDNTVERYGNTGIAADGGDRADASAEIDGNTIRGQGAGGSYPTQIGLLADETPISAEDNIISDNITTGEANTGIGIFLEFANGPVRDNTVTNNLTGVRFSPGSGTEFRSNTVRNNRGNGIELIQTNDTTLVENESSNNGGNGIFIGVGATGNTVRDNKVRNNGSTDIVDANGTPLVNTYKSNTCKTSNPSGLCK